MKQAIRALSFAINILWVLLLFFSATLVYSALKLGVGLGEPRATASYGIVTTSLPLFFNNSGFYDVFDLNFTTHILDGDETLISNSTTLIPLISRGNRVKATHNIPVSLSYMISKNLTRLLFNDSVLDVDMYIAFKYAHAVHLQFSSNMTLPWGAPLANLTVGEISIASINFTHYLLTASLSFENHSIFSLNGTIQLEIVDRSNRTVGTGTTSLNVLPQSGYRDQIEVVIGSDSQDVKEVHIYFSTSMFNFGPLVIPIG